MNTRHARMILSILREGSFTAAAKALSITQPTLSQTVRQIETQLGEPIFARGKTPVQLTQAGELYVQAARRIIQAETQLQEAISMLHGHTEGLLRIGVTNQRSNELLPQIIPDFFSVYPGVRMEICEADPQALEQLLLNGELDMALFSSEKQHSKLEYRQIASEEVVLITSKKTPLAQRIPSGTTIGLREAEHERFVLPPSNDVHRRFFDGLLESCSVSPDTQIVCDGVGTAMRLCANSNLIALVPFISLLCDSSSMQRLAHYHLGTDAYLPPFYMVYSKEQPLAVYGETLFTLLSNRFRAMTAYRP